VPPKFWNHSACGVWRVGVTLKPTGPLQRLAATPSPGSNTFQEKKVPPNFSTFRQKQIIFLVEPEKKFRVVYLLLVLYSIILPNFCGVYIYICLKH
jgi:hypothetical protein